MLPHARRVWLLLCLVAPPAMGQVETLWTARQGDWFDKANWSAGVPNEKVAAAITSGTANVGGSALLRVSPSAAQLTLGRSNAKVDSAAELLVNGTNLDVSGRFVLAESHGGNVVGSLAAQVGTAKDSGNISAGDTLIGFVGQGGGTAEGKLNVDGSVFANAQRTNPNLDIGLNLATGSAVGNATVRGAMGSTKAGYRRVSVGRQEGNAAGTAIGTLDVGSLFGGGKGATLAVGFNDGLGQASGQLTLRDSAFGFDQVFVGGGSGRGTAIGSIVVDGTLQASQIVLGTENGRGQGTLTLNDRARVEASLLTVNPASELIAGFDLATSLRNGGSFSLNGLPGSNRPGEAKVAGDFLQSRTGVTHFDVLGSARGAQYEAITVGGKVELGGRIDLELGPNFSPKVGESLTLFDAPLATDAGLSFNLINPPRDLALRSEIGKGGVKVEFVKAEPSRFLNPTGGDVQWADPSIWGGVVPSSINQVELFNNSTKPQTIAIGSNVTVQSALIGGVEGMNLAVPEGLDFSATHQLQIDSHGSVSLDGGSLISSEVEFSWGSLFRGTGSIIGNVSNQGAFRIGSNREPASLIVDGDFVQDRSGLFELDVRGTGEGQFDQLVVDGRADLNGVFLVNLPDDFKPGNAVPLITATEGITGNFNVRFAEGHDFSEIEFGFSTGETEVIMFSQEIGPGEIGDMNRDSFVDECDLDAFSLALRDVDAYFDEYDWWPAPRGNVNDDGEFDVDDIEPFFALIDGVACQPEAVHAIPEPTTIMLTSFAVAAILRLRRRRICHG